MDQISLILALDRKTPWSRPNANFILLTSFQVPSPWGAATPLALFLPLGDAGNFCHPEALAYIDGAPYATCDRFHHEIPLRPQWADGRPHELALLGWTGLGENWNTDPATYLIMRPCSVVQIDQPTRDFITAARIALETVQILPTHSPTRVALLNALEAAFVLLDTREPFDEHFYASLPGAYAALQAGIQKAGPPLEVSLAATGHAHIDVAWLWGLDQTRAKAARTFFTVLRLMEQFPEYHFTQSQPQLYEVIRQDHPEVFQAFQERVSEGRWGPIGGMWVEADCNLSGAKALVRQFLLGRSFFRQHFGAGAEGEI